ncbi:hypothetical protein Hamer_G014104 [Homarus americanus]|uniref:Uncharacterized protein n=2 Tax=Homarus americanus TaxID=6706 RepID=A0A8J5JNJ5_HOMAM|nr:hypothetical protein Hamer_G014104 [Homarus americanus]
MAQRPTIGKILGLVVLLLLPLAVQTNKLDLEPPLETEVDCTPKSRVMKSYLVLCMELRVDPAEKCALNMCKMERSGDRRMWDIVPDSIRDIVEKVRATSEDGDSN